MARIDDIRQLRHRLPVSIAWCRDALAATDDLDAAIAWLKARLSRELGERTGLSADAAREALAAVGWDLEAAWAAWLRRNPPPPPPARERLVAGRELAAWIDVRHPELRRVAHVLPRGDGRFELRRLTHRAVYTETDFGLDVDCALLDLATRVRRLTVHDVDVALDQLAAWGVVAHRLQPPERVDSCVVNSTIDSYLDDVERFNHLWLDDALDIRRPKNLPIHPCPKCRERGFVDNKLLTFDVEGRFVEDFVVSDLDRYLASDYTNGAFVAALFCRQCQIGFVPDELLASLDIVESTSRGRLGWSRPYGVGKIVDDSHWQGSDRDDDNDDDSGDDDG